MRGGFLTVLALPLDLRIPVSVPIASLLLSPTSLRGLVQSKSFQAFALSFRMHTTAYPSWTVKQPCSQSTMDTEVTASTVFSPESFSVALRGCLVAAGPSIYLSLEICSFLGSIFFDRCHWLRFWKFLRFSRRKVVSWYEIEMRFAFCLLKVLRMAVFLVDKLDRIITEEWQ